MMTHAHMTEVRVWLPGVTVRSDHVRVWLKRYGTSQVYDQQGAPWTFTHGARTMLYDYSTRDHTHVTPNTRADNYKENTRVRIDEDSSDYVALSPIGPWSLSVSERYNPGVDTTKVNAIYLQLSYSFLPCAQPECPIRTRNVTAKGSSFTTDVPIGPQKQDGGQPSGEPGSQAATIVGVTLGVVIAVCVIILIVLYLKKRRALPTIIRVGGTYDQI